MHPLLLDVYARLIVILPLTYRHWSLFFRTLSSSSLSLPLSTHHFWKYEKFLTTFSLTIRKIITIKTELINRRRIASSGSINVIFLWTGRENDLTELVFTLHVWNRVATSRLCVYVVFYKYFILTLVIRILVILTLVAIIKKSYSKMQHNAVNA